MEKKRILIVDDEKNVRIALLRALEHFDREIDFAENGAEAIAFIEKRSYNLVITDHVMPEMDGVELIQRIRTIFHSMPVLMVTGGRPEGDLLKCGATEYIEKPFDVFELQKRVKMYFLNKSGQMFWPHKQA